MRGQYIGYRAEEGVDPESDTETFIALKCSIDNWRWAGVPFFLRTGKRLAEGQRIISIAFREPPKSMFPVGSGVGAQGPDHLTFDLADASKMSLSFYGKRPGPGMRLDKLSLQFAMHDTGLIGDVLEAYERLILDAMRGDHTLFTTAEGIERLWEVSIPLLENPPPVRLYPPGSWGPKSIHQLVAPHAWRLPFERAWRDPERQHDLTHGLRAALRLAGTNLAVRSGRAALDESDMRILLVNPNTTASMTAKIGAAAQAVASASTTVLAVNPSSGPASIEGYYDEVFSIPGLIAEMAKVPDADAYVIACFDDTGLDAARCATDRPVVGIGEAAFHMASLLAGRFGVVTTLSRSIPAIEHNLVRYGLASRCAGVRASEIPVLDLEKPGSAGRERIRDEARRSIDEDRAEAVVLGCAGMVDFASALTGELGVPVLDGVACAVRLCEALAGLGLRTSKAGGYAWPRPKAYSGAMSEHAPRER